MINLIQSPSTSYAYSRLLTHGDGDGAHGRWRLGGEDGGEDGLRIPPHGGEILDQSVPEMKIVVVAAVCFAKAPLPLGQVFFLIYEGVRRRPEARRFPRPIWGGPTRLQYQAAWPPLLALRHPSFPPFCSTCFLSRKSDVVFFPDFSSCKNSQRRDFAKKQRQKQQFYSNMEGFRSKL